MVAIKIDDFVKSFVKTNKDFKSDEFRPILEEAIREKENGAKCNICGQPIWAIGSAICGWNGCFTCISGDSDSSEDYEIDSVCWE